MPRLSEPMRKALEAAERRGRLIHDGFGWRTPGNPSTVMSTATVDILTLQGLLLHDHGDRVITPAGREAIGQPLPSPPEAENG